jgi:hypothetical protein
VRVLLKKDWLILRRNWFYIVMFTLLPVVMMSVFWYMAAVMDSHLKDEKHNFDCKPLDPCRHQVQQDRRKIGFLLGLRYGEAAKSIRQRRPRQPDFNGPVCQEEEKRHRPNRAQTPDRQF